MKRLWNCLAALLVVFALLPVRARAAELLIPVGKVVGLQLRDGSVTVAAFDDVLGADAKAAGLKIGDEIIQIDETAIGCPEDVRRALETCDGDAELTLRRGSRRRSPVRIGRKQDLSCRHFSDPSFPSPTVAPHRSADSVRLHVHAGSG